MNVYKIKLTYEHGGPYYQAPTTKNLGVLAVDIEQALHLVKQRHSLYKNVQIKNIRHLTEIHIADKDEPLCRES